MLSVRFEVSFPVKLAVRSTFVFSLIEVYFFIWFVELKFYLSKEPIKVITYDFLACSVGRTVHYRDISQMHERKHERGTYLFIIRCPCLCWYVMVKRHTRFLRHDEIHAST